MDLRLLQGSSELLLAAFQPQDSLFDRRQLPFDVFSGARSNLSKSRVDCSDSSSTTTCPNEPLAASELQTANSQATVYHGLPRDVHTFQERPGDYLVFLGRLSHLMIRKPVGTADGRVGR